MEFQRKFSVLRYCELIFRIKKKNKFSIGNLYKIYKKMFGNVWKWAGKKRKTEKNIGFDKTQIDVELKKLLDDLKYFKHRNLLFGVALISTHFRSISPV